MRPLELTIRTATTATAAWKGVLAASHKESHKEFRKGPHPLFKAAEQILDACTQ